MNVASGIYVMGYDAVNSRWLRVQVNEDGKLIIDPAAIFENPPTEDETKKAPNSEWAYDHKNDASAHHTKTTDADEIDEGTLLSTLQYNGDIYAISSTTENEFFDRFDDLIPGVGDKIKITGGLYESAYAGIWYATYLERTGVNEMKFRAFGDDGNVKTRTITNGNGSNFYDKAVLAY